MNATLLTGHATAFLVDGDTVACSNPRCSIVRVLTVGSVGMACPLCKQGKLERRQHYVDVAELGGVGQCGCENFRIEGMKLLKRIGRDRWDASAIDENVLRAVRCKHIQAARAVLLAGGREFDALLARLHQEQDT